MTLRRGPRGGGEDTQAKILDAARALFAARGFEDASLRAIAADAGVDPRLIAHYFGTKADLFVAAFRFPFDTTAAVEYVAGPGAEGFGGRLAEFSTGILFGEESSRTMSGLIRAAASHPDAAQIARERLVSQLLLPVATRLGVSHAPLRAELMGTQIAGFVVGRYILQMPHVATVQRSVVSAAWKPVFDHYLTVPLDCAVPQEL